MRLLAVALKMGSAFESVDKLAADWIEKGWRDLKTKLTPEEFEDDEDRKRMYYDLSDRLDAANKALRDKLVRFNVESRKVPPDYRERSAILRYERAVDTYGVEGKVFLGLDSPQAKGYRIVKISHPVWLEELMKSKVVFFTEEMDEGAVYALVSGDKMNQENLSVLHNDFWKDLEEAGIPAFEKIGDVTHMRAEFVSRFEKAIDKRLPFDKNVLRADALVQQIKREYALAVPSPRGIAVVPPLSPLTGAVIVTPPAREERKRLEEWYVLYNPMNQTYVLNYQYRSSWDMKTFKSFEEARDFLGKEEGSLYLHAYRGIEPTKWSYPVPMAPFRLKVKEHWEVGKDTDRHLYSLEQPSWNGLQWIWRVSHSFQYGQIYRHEDVEAAEGELLRGKFGYGGKKEEPIKTVSTPLYTTADVTPKAALQPTEEEKEVAVLNAIKKELRGKGGSHGDILWLDAKIGGQRVGTYEEVREITQRLLNRGLVVEWSPGLYRLPSEAPAAGVAPEKPLDPLDNEAILSALPFRGEIPVSFEQMIADLAEMNFDVRHSTGGEEKARAILNNLIKKGDVYEPRPGFFSWTEKSPDEEEELEEAKVEKVEVAEVIKENAELIKTYEKELPAAEVKRVQEELKVAAEPKKAKEEKPKPIESKPVISVPLTAEEKQLLRDLWITQFFRSLGKVPANLTSVFNVEFEGVKTLPFAEAKEKVLAAADEIISEFQAREVTKRATAIRPTVLPRVPERAPTRATRDEVEGEEAEEGGKNNIPFGRVPPSQFPSFPLSYNMPFPRGPTSEEQVKIWNVFCYKMQEEGYDCSTYQRQFEEYISGTQFLSWEDLREKFGMFVKTVMSGMSLPPLFTWRGAPLPTGLKGEIQELEPLEKLESLLVHYSSVVIRNARSQGDIPTLSDLKKELVELGIIPDSTGIAELRDSVKTALTRAQEKNDFRLTGISSTEINDFLSS